VSDWIQFAIFGALVVLIFVVRQKGGG